eukprot:augustus_masked-scaffold_8-processed-gene-14.100-mRNA-1 protein AED:1.00 eAED:1.00 QI:0/0/0/0/1/1/2/0/656
MSGSEKATTPRAMNQAQVKKMLTDMNAEQMKMLTALMGNIMNQMPEISELKDFSVENIKKFIYHYERLNEQQRNVVELKQKLSFSVYEAMDDLGRTGSNEAIITYLKEKLKKNRTREDLTAVELMRKYVVFREDIDPFEVVDLVFKKVDKILKELLEGSKLKPKQIAKAIFSILPGYIWVRNKDLEMRGDLEGKDKRPLKKYVLSCIPPMHLIEKSKMLANMEVGVRKMGSEDQVYVEKYLCLYCYCFGHHEQRCWMKKQGKPRSEKPETRVLNERWNKYIERWKKKKQEEKKKNEEPQQVEKVEQAGDTHSILSGLTEAMNRTQLTAEEESSPGTPRNSNMNKIKGEEGYDGVDHIQYVNELFGSDMMLKTMRNEVVKEIENGPQEIKYSRVQRDAEVRVQINGEKEVCFALLDSGAFRSAMNIELKPFCTEVLELENSIKVVAAGGSTYEVTEVGYLEEVKLFLDSNVYFLLDVYAMILDVEKWDDIIIGNDVLKKHRLDPVSALRHKLRAERGGVKHIGEGSVLADWFMRKVVNAPVVTKVIEEEEDFTGAYEEWKRNQGFNQGQVELIDGGDTVEEPADWCDEWGAHISMTSAEEELGHLVRAINWPAKLCNDEPVGFDADEKEEEELDPDGLIDIGANLDVDVKEDRKRMA